MHSTSSRISQSQRIASLLLKELHKFAGNLQAGHAEGGNAGRPAGQCAGHRARVKPCQPGMQGGTGSTGVPGAPPAAGWRRAAREPPAHLTSGTAAGRAAAQEGVEVTGLRQRGERTGFV